MKSLIKVFFILVVTVSTFTCFADAAAELRELNHLILYPITRHFSESSSDTRCIYSEIIKQKIQKKRQLTDEELDKIFEILGADPSIYNTYCQIQSTRNSAGCKPGAMESMYIGRFAKLYLTMWQLRVANCSEYAELAMIAFAFNWVNNEKMEQKQLFKGAVIVTSQRGTGDHGLLLVEGVSGTLFVVDPWIRKVIPVDKSFPSLPIITYGIESHPDPRGIKLINIPSHFASELTKLYRDKDSNYYDGIFVREDTQWVLQIFYSKRIQSFVYQYDDDMKNFYNTLRPNFPGWVKPYDKLPLDHVKQGKVNLAI